MTDEQMAEAIKGQLGEYLDGWILLGVTADEQRAVFQTYAKNETVKIALAALLNYAHDEASKE